MDTQQPQLRSKLGQSFKPLKSTLSKDGDTKTFTYNDMPVNSPIGVLCTLTGVTTTIYRAPHASGGYDCYVTIFYAVTGGLGWTNSAAVALNPPGGLSLTAAPVTDQGGFLANENFPRVSVPCAGVGPNGQQLQVDPDLFDLTSAIAVLINASSWSHC